MATTTDKNKIREGVVDAVLNAILDSTSGEVEYIDRSSIKPKVIRDGQIVDSGALIDDTYTTNETRVLFSNDFKAIVGFEGDFVDDAVDTCYLYPDTNQYADKDFTLPGIVTYDSANGIITLNNCVTGTPDTPEDGTPYLIELNKDNIDSFLSQYVTFQTGSVGIDSLKAEQILDTRVHELLPNELSRQERINKFFSEFLQLAGPIPNFDLDVDFDNVMDTWNENDIVNEQNLYYSGSSVIENPQTGNIVRLNRHAQNTINQNKTIQSLRDTLNNYLTDIDKKVEPDVEDDRPEYKNRNDGYLKIRNLNQSILVRNEQGNDIGIVGNDINNPTYLDTGFTIAMWVRFLDRTGGGTLFNFGNPVRSLNPKGFRLETYTLYKNDKLRPDQDYTWMEYIQTHTEGSDYQHEQLPGNGCIDPSYGPCFSEDHTFFRDGDYERFVRLIVREDNGVPRESNTGARKAKEGMVFARKNHSGMNNIPSNGTYPIIWPEEQEDADNHFPNRLLSYTRIPIDFDEWYYIVATYDPNIKEDESFGYEETYSPDGIHRLAYFSEFWNGNVFPQAQPPSDEQILNNPDNLDGDTLIGKYVTKSGFGNKCKVEIISKSALLRARGFKPESGNQGATDSGNQVVGG